MTRSRYHTNLNLLCLLALALWFIAWPGVA